MISLNRIQLIGHLTEDASVRELPNGVSVADVNLLVKTIIKNSSWEDQEISSYHNITFWRWLADVVKNYTKKWSQVFVSWRLETDSWDDQEWKKRYKTKVVAEDLILLSRKDEQDAPWWWGKIFSWINKAEVIGNITWDLELRTTPNWTPVTSFWLATNRQWKTTAWETQEKAQFHNIVAWEKLAESITSNAKKWSKLYICWRAQNRSWETPEWEKKYTTEIIAESIRLLGYVNNSIPDSWYKRNQNEVKTEVKTEEKTETQNSPAKDPDTPNMSEVNFSSDIKPEDLPF